MVKLWIILIGAAAGAALIVPVEFLCARLLRQRGREFSMTKKHRLWMLLCLTLCGALIGWRASVTWRALYLLLMLGVAASVAYIDATTRLIPNELVLSVIALAAIFGFSGAITFRIGSSLLGFAVCLIVFLLPALFRKAVGEGDVKLAAAMGFALGLTNSLYAIVCMGILVFLYFIIERKAPLVASLKAMIPMGPFLAAALVVVSAL